MEKIKQKISVKELFIIIAMIAPFTHSQLITGSIINATFFFAVYFLGMKKAMPLAFIPSLMAFSTGLITSFIFIPLIITSNLLLMALFEKYKNNISKAILIASLGKTGFFFVLALILPIFGYIFTLTQLVTVLIGGLIFLKGKNYF